jgi:hypothetical protein
MFKPNFQRTEMIARIEVARDRILRAPIVPRWEAELRREALVTLPASRATLSHYKRSPTCWPVAMSWPTPAINKKCSTMPRCCATSIVISWTKSGR